MLHIIIGIIGALIIWKLIKLTFRSLFWFVVAGLVAFLIFPKALAFVGGAGFLIVGFFITLIVLVIGGLGLYEYE